MQQELRSAEESIQEADSLARTQRADIESHSAELLQTRQELKAALVQTSSSQQEFPDHGLRSGTQVCCKLRCQNVA